MNFLLYSEKKRSQIITQTYRHTDIYRTCTGEFGYMLELLYIHQSMLKPTVQQLYINNYDCIIITKVYTKMKCTQKLMIQLLKYTKIDDPIIKIHKN